MNDRLHIMLEWYGGIVTDEDRNKPPPEPNCGLYRCSGETQEIAWFDSCLELERYIALHFPKAEWEALPPAGPEETEKLRKVFALLDHPPEMFDTSYLRSALAGMLYQWSHPPETVARLRRELRLPPLASG